MEGAVSQEPSQSNPPGQTQDQTAAEKQKALLEQRQKDLEKLLQEMQKAAGTPVQAPVPAPIPQNPPPVPGIAPLVPNSLNQIQLKFDAMPLFEFITNVADMLGITPILIDPDVKGTATIYSSTAMAKEDVFPIFSSVLKNNNAALVKSGNFYKIVPISQGLREGLEIVDSPPPAPPAKPPSDKDAPKKTDPAAAGPAKPPAPPGTVPPAGTPPPGAAVTQPPAGAAGAPQTPPAQTLPVPQATPPSQTRPTAPAPPHLATHIIRVEFVPVQSLVEPLKLFMTEGGVIMPYERQNMLIITDYTDNVQKLLEVVHLLDNSYLDPDLIELIEIKFNVAADVLEDLQKVFGTTKDSGTGIYMVSLDRINAILVMANSKRALEEVKRWIARLDTTTGRSVQTFIYTVENGTASNIAMVLSLLYGGSESGTSVGMQPTGAGGGYSGGAPGGTGTGGRMGTGTGTGGIPYSSAPGSSRSMTSALGGSSMFGGGGQQGYGQQGYGGFNNPYGYGAGVFGGQQIGGPRLNQGMGGMTAQVLNGGQFSGLQGTVRLVADDMNNALIIQGSRADYEYLLETIKRMDILPRQAIIDARIFEIDLTESLSFGVSATLQARQPGDGLTTGSIAAGTGALSAQSFAFVGASRDILMNLNALRAKTKVRILEAPSVLAIDGMPAHIQVGGSQPIPGQTVIGGTLATSSVDYVPTGTELEITPRISASGTVTLMIYQGVTTIGPASTVNGQPTPTFNTTNVTTTLAVKDGESVAIAGMIREANTNGRSGVPFFSDIPLLGALFGSTNRSNTRTELLIMITPHVIRTPERFREMTDQIKDSLRSVGKYADEKQKEIKEDQEKGLKERFDQQQKQIKKSEQKSDPPPPIKKEEEPSADVRPRIPDFDFPHRTV